MRILREFIDPTQIENVVVEDESGKNIKLKGIFAQAEVKNKNGRIYPLAILEREIHKLRTRIAATGLTGELDHPERPDYKLENAAMVIKSILQDGNNFIGEAELINEGKGKLAMALAKKGIKFGVSTRSLGSLTEAKDGTMVVNEDLNMITIDIVADPSAPQAWVDSIMEKKEWLVEDGYIKEDVANSYKNRIKALPKKEIEEGVIKLFDEFFQEV